MVFTQLNQPISSPRWGLSTHTRKRKTHHYDGAAWSSEFCLEATPDQSGFFMTSCKAGVRRGDLIQICDVDGCSEYRVDEIDFYSEPADMWIAKLRTA